MTREIPHKSETMKEICDLLNIPLSKPSIGSSVPSVFFSDIAAHMGLEQLGNMPAMAKQIVEANNLEWFSEFSSEESPSGGGGTVTALGLVQVKHAVVNWLSISTKQNIGYQIWSPDENWQEIKSHLERQLVERIPRPGSDDFRKEVLAKYRHKCAVSDTASLEVIEVAHIVPYHGEKSDVLPNALPLRVDFHKLFDCGKLFLKYVKDGNAIEVQFHDSVKRDYSDFHQTQLRLPEFQSDWPSQIALQIKLGLSSKS